MYSHENLALREDNGDGDERRPSSYDKDQSRPGVNFLFYYEDLDCLISGYEDNKIRVWGYNEETLNVPEMAHLIDSEANNEGVTNRVAGMSLKATLNEHNEAVTCLVCFQYDGKHWIVR